MEDLGNFSIRWPEDQAEQTEMANAAIEHQLETAAVRVAINHQVALLSERRQALITAAVTGQIDVNTAGGVAV
jgi:type I restriction enzyme S subunit